MFIFLNWQVPRLSWARTGLSQMNLCPFLFTPLITPEIWTCYSINYDYENANFARAANQWHHLKIEIRENSILYYIDGNLVATGKNFTKTNIEGLNFVHNNFNGAASIDHIKINNTVLGVPPTQSEKLVTYPNPVEDFLTIELPQKIRMCEVYNAVG